MAIIYTRCGQFDLALDELEVLLSQQTGFSVNALKMNNNFDPLRKLPRYQEMMQKYSGSSGLQ